MPRNPFYGNIHPTSILIIATAIKKGNTLKNSCALAGVSMQTFRTRMKAAAMHITEREMRQEEIAIRISQFYENNPQLIPTDEDTPQERSRKNKILKEHPQLVELQAILDDKGPDGCVIDEERPEVMLYRAVKAAEAELEDTLVDTWYNLRHTDWKAAKEFLARRFPKDWGEVKTKNVQVSGPGGGPIPINTMDLSKLTTEELENLEQLLSKVPQSRDDSDGEV